MNPEASAPLVLALDDVSATLLRVGGKGVSLARMARAGFLVPERKILYRSGASDYSTAARTRAVAESVRDNIVSSGDIVYGCSA